MRTASASETPTVVSGMKSSAVSTSCRMVVMGSERNRNTRTPRWLRSQDAAVVCAEAFWTR